MLNAIIIDVSAVITGCCITAQRMANYSILDFVVVDYFCNFTSGRKVGLVGNSHFNPARAGVWAELGNYIDQ